MDAWISMLKNKNITLPKIEWKKWSLEGGESSRNSGQVNNVNEISLWN